ncbi:MAG: ribosome-associated translation inhibitor RaiA [Gemmatimonadota bacterium]
MPTRITAKNAKVSDRTKEHIEQACEKLRQFYDRIIDCEVILERTPKNGHAVELKVLVPQHTLVAHSESADDNLFKCVDEARDRMEAQLKKHHDKLVEHR